MAMFHRITLCMFLICALEFSQTDELPGPGNLVSLNKSVTSSSQHKDAGFLVSHAVDGSTRRDSAQCNCCAATIQENNPWIQIDLGRLYRVVKVEIIGRTDYVDPFNMAIFVSANNTSWQGNTPTQPTLPDVPEQYHNVTLSYPVIGQFVTLQLNGSVLLCVCEVNIYSKDCSNGSYGLFCNETCGQCQDGETCDHVTGRCTRCRTGYELPSCTKECMPGTFGPDCSYICHCKDNTTCDHVNGSCPDNNCDSGWQGSNCSLECSLGTFGETCSFLCHCNNNNTCNHVSGSCPDNICDVGWRGSNCSQECESGTFGQNCSSLCHCYDNKTCNHVTGTCSLDLCDVRWEGANCSLSTLRSHNANVTGSSLYTENKDRFNLSHAVDGSTSMDPIACNCCAATANDNQPWIQIDLGRLYRVSNIEVNGRLNTSKPFVGMHIYIHTQKNNWTKTNNLQLTIPNVTEQVFISVFDYPVIGQYVTLQLPDDNVILLVCEVSIYSNDCNPGTYGLHCNETCGQCRDGETCDHVTGRCTWCESGYMGDHCKKECLPGSFGSNCSSNCHCQYNLTCDHVNGSCPSGKCDLGWHGSNCSQRCLAGRFGDNCSSSCHCLNNQTCDPSTGMCPGGKCAPSWEGTSCSNTLISLNANVTASSKHPNSKFALSRAVDGSNSTDSTSCLCCAATADNDSQPWIKIDLGRQYRVATVNVTSRTDWLNGVPFAGIHIYLHEKKDNWISNHALDKTITDNGSRYYITTLNKPVIAQYVTLQIPKNNTWLLVCEVSVFSSNCNPGTYGPDCNETCGQCQNKEPCDHVNGSCELCLPGYQLPLCKQECLPGSFGTRCFSSCHCRKSLTCNHVNGSCLEGCDLGWYGSNCSLECPPGTYGLECNKTCGYCQDNQTCNHVTGNCMKCALGYEFPLCNETCSSGSYGLFCNNTCGKCQGEEACNHATGSCTRCRPGYQHPLCTDECPPGRFSQDCAAACNCNNNRTCDHVTGECPDNICGVGWMGSNCSIECDNMTYGINCSEECGNCYQKSCDRRTGDCSPCSDGYTGPRCLEVCPNETFGSNCSSICHCYDNLTCDHVTGSCPDDICDLGWKGFNCSQECLPGTFGSNCYSICRCFDNVTCDHVTGSCINGTCDVGWQGSNCSEVCPTGTFGFNCSSICHCHDSITCDHVTGSCPDDRCGLGWQGFNCSEVCSPRTYGANCSLTCGHCRNGVPCDRISGICHLCQLGYTGTTCHNATVIITNVTVSGSSENPDASYNLAYVVDGSNRTDSAVCNCCAATQRENDPWLQLDLGRMYMVATVEILGRTDFNDSLSEMNIYIHTNSTEWNQTLTFTQTLSNVTDQHYVTTSQHPVIGQYVTLEKPGNNVSLYVCEVTVYIQDCSSGTYGLYCNEACGQCLDGETCDHVTGICARCSPGYQLPLCKQTCPVGMFGENCTQQCGRCANITACNSSTGHCDGDCETGFTGQLCEEELKSMSPADNFQNPAGAIVGSVLAVICALIIVLIVIIRLTSKGLVKNKYLSAVVGRLSEISPSMTWRKMSDSDPGTPVEDADVISLHERAIEIPDDTDRRDLNNYDAPHIPVNMIWDYIRQEHKTDDGTILSEFKLLKKCPFYVSTFACLEENIPKNRYKGYQAYDHTRVRLVRTVGGETDYINANYIQGFERRNKFIASQGPTVVMVEDFWLMVVQQNCSIIVMLTNVFEMGVKKCLQYWPSVGQMKFGSISVTLLDEEEFPDYIIRRLEIKLTDDGPGHVVNQYHFVSWPDKDVPDNVWCLVNFWRAVDSKAASLTTPVLVHCSAGVGRTGTFIGLDYLFYQAEATESVCPFEVAKKLRQQRMKMIQTPAQYVYLHEALAEAILFGTTAITQDQFEEQYEYMTTTGKDGTSGFGKQFKLISDSIEHVETVIEETEYSNVDWNVNGDGNVSSDACTTVTGVINLPMVTGPNSCLLVRSPGSDDVEMIWKIISKFSVSTVIMATSTAHPNYEVSLNLDVSDRWSNGSLHIQVVSCDEKPKRTSFCLNGTTKVTQFQIPGCEGDSPVPRDVNAVVATLNSIEARLEEQENPGPILIHCGDGVSTSGLIAVILNELLRMKLQNGTINIVESVKTIKAVEKNVVTSVDQLQFCYDVVWAYLHPNVQEDVYMNV